MVSDSARLVAVLAPWLNSDPAPLSIAGSRAPVVYRSGLGKKKKTMPGINTEVFTAGDHLYVPGNRGIGGFLYL